MRLRNMAGVRCIIICNFVFTVCMFASLVYFMVECAKINASDDDDDDNIDDLDVTNSPHASFFHGHFVHTTRQKGLTQDCADAIMRILGPRSAKD